MRYLSLLLNYVQYNINDLILTYLFKLKDDKSEEPLLRLLSKVQANPYLTRVLSQGVSMPVFREKDFLAFLLLLLVLTFVGDNTYLSQNYEVLDGMLTKVLLEPD